MGLEIRRKPDGKLKSKYWYGSFSAGGKRHVKNLDVEIKGIPPPTLREDGDAAFERSRGRAKIKLQQAIAQARSAKSSESMLQEIHEIKYGSRIESFPVADLVKAWDAMPKKRRSLVPRYAKDVRTTLQRFLDFLEEHHPKVIDAAQVDRRIARAFLEAEDARGISDKTWNDSLKRVRATFRFLQTEYGLWRNPFDGIRMREEHTHHRRPLSEDQVKKLLDKAAGNDFCRPLLVCGLSTAMRLGDCCQLRWTDVDLAPRCPTVTVKTAKTGQTVCIPVYERLQAELQGALAARRDQDEFVWPRQAALYRRNHTLVSSRLRRLFRAALGKDALLADRERGVNRASVYDFHSLRTTWITEALSRGVPIETVKLVSGHKTVEVVTKHYFHPSTDQIRNALHNALPGHLTGAALLPSPNPTTAEPGRVLARAIQVLKAVTGKANQERVAKAVELLEQAIASLEATPASAACV